MNLPIRLTRHADRTIPLRLLALGLAVSVSTRAGLVTWEPATTIAGISEVSTSGTLVVAHNLGGSTNVDTTVNGVLFKKFVTNGPVNTLGNVTLSAASNILGASTFGEDFVAPFATLPASYKTLLESASFTGGPVPPPTITLALAGLSVGTQYQFQWWANQSSFFSFDPNSPPAFPSTTATAGNSVSLARTGALSGSLGQYAIGVSTADAPTQSIAFTGSNPQTVLNAFQLRALSPPVVPEPGSCLFVVAVIGAMCARRRLTLQP